MARIDSRNPSSIAVIGGGWAGCAAAVELARKGHRVCLFEAGRVLGGRARGVELQGQQLDNGQHILLGAYETSLRLMKLVGVDTDAALLRLPLQMRYPPGSGGMDFVAPALPAPLHLLVALLRASGLQRADKLALARFSSTARWMGWRLHVDCSVTELLERFDQTERLVRFMWRPLCIAALNTPPERASAQVFLNVLRDSLGARRKASDMLLPRQDLSALFPAAAARYVGQAAGEVRLGAAVSAITREQGKWRLAFGAAVADLDSQDKTATTGLYDQVIVATPAWEAARLLGALGLESPAATLEYEPITTCYLQYEAGTGLAQPFHALVDDAATGHWGQFVFDRGQLFADQAGLLAVVVSASAPAIEAGRAALTQAICAQLADVLKEPRLATPLWSRVITEKRATFACTPALQRPDNRTSLPGLWIAGDFTASDYPATLESATRSGVAAALLAMETAPG